VNIFAVTRWVARERLLCNGRGTISVPITLIQFRSKPSNPTEKHAHTIIVTVLFR
jgi:hypothetical protein